jgi:hypothetical protein
MTFPVSIPFLRAQVKSFMHSWINAMIRSLLSDIMLSLNVADRWVIRSDECETVT